MERKINYLLLSFIGMFIFIGNIYALDNYKLPTLVFNKETEIKYLTDSDKAEFMDKFGLTEYDGAVIITSDSSYKYLVDYYETEMYDPDYAPYYGNLKNDDSSFDGYICSKSYLTDMEFSDKIMEIRRDNNKLSFGYLYGANYTYYRCGNTDTQEVAAYMDSNDFYGEGLYYNIINESKDVKEAIFVYYIKDINKSVLNFKSSKKVKKIKASAISERNKIADKKYFVPDYHKAELRTDYQSYLDELDMDYLNGYFSNTYGNFTDKVTLIPKEGFKFKIDQNESTYKLDEIKSIYIKYHHLIRNTNPNMNNMTTIDSVASGDFNMHNYGFGVPHEYEYYSDGIYKPFTDDIKLNEMFDIEPSSNGLTSCRKWDYTQGGINVYFDCEPNFVTIEIRTIDGESHVFSFIYDTPENRKIFNLTKIDKIEYPYELSKYIKGDMNGNDKIDLPDIIISLKKYLGLEETTSLELEIADMDQDGKLSLKDIISLLKVYLGIN